MLYIASALTPTPVIDTIRLESFTAPGSLSLVAAKPDSVEVWDVSKDGLTLLAEMKIWGNVISIAQAAHSNSAPHILVLTSPPNAQLLLLAFHSGPKPALVVTSSISLTPPTPSLRQAEYFNAVISQGNIALVSLWTGVLSCIELDFEKDKDAKRRRPSAIAKETQGDARGLQIQDHFNINIREHNLLQMVFMPPNHNQTEPVVSVIWQSSTKALLLQTRAVSLASHSFEDKTTAVNVVTPVSDVQIANEDDFDFNDIPYSCPAARHVLPVSPDSVLIIGDEHSVLYKLSRTSGSPRVSRASVSSASGTATISRASAVRRSPQNEMSAPGKRRKSSNTARRSLDGMGDRWELKPIWRGRQGFGTVLAASTIESHDTGATVALSDESGRLTVYGWEIDVQAVAATGQRGTVHLSKVDAGSASPASSMTYLDASHLFLASSCGDSMLIELHTPSLPATGTSPNKGTARDIPSRKGKDRLRDDEEGAEWALEASDAKGGFAIKERWLNLAPLRDFCVVEDEGGGMSHLVAASGAASSNSLRTIRSGVGLDDRLTIQGFSDVTAMYSIGDRLLISTRTSTTLLQIDPDTRVLPLTGALSDLPTLAVGRPDESLLLHVSPAAISLCSLKGDLDINNTWHPSGREVIVAACISDGLIAVAKRGGDVTILRRNSGQVEELLVSREVASVAIISHPSQPSPVIAVATWSAELLLYSLDHLRNAEPLVTPLQEAHTATSLALRAAPFSESSSGLQLLAGLSDGTMVIYDVNFGSDGGGVSATNRKASGLGTHPLQLVPIEEIDNEDTIIGVGLSERMSVIFESKGRIDFSTVNRKNVTAATCMSIGGEDCLVLASPAGITFTAVTSLKKLSVQTLDLQDRSPVKLVSLPDHNVLGVGSISRKMDSETGDLVQKGYFELRDQTTLELLVEMPLDPREQVTSLNSVFLLGRQYIAVGTALFSDDETDEYSHGAGMLYAKEGKLYLVEVRQAGKSWEIAIKTSFETGGAVHDSVTIHGFLAIAAASKVAILRLDASPFAFTEVSQFSSAFIAQHLYVAEATKIHKDARLIVGDGMRSIFALEVDDESGTIYADQRDLATYQVMGLEGIRDHGQSVIVADGNSNLLTLRLNDNIETAASFGLHEPISQFRKGSLVPSSSAPDVMRPELLFGTVDGRLGVIGELTAGATATLNDLQRNMDKYHLGPGEVDWRTWRRGGTEMIKRETAGFIDGDFAQQFLDLDMVSAEEQTRLVNGTNQHERISRLSAEGKMVAAEKGDVIGVLEALAGLH